jgi:DNA-binding CsgD family transcriptional regulator
MANHQAAQVGATLLRQGPLTQREAQVLLSLCCGKSVKDIAREVGCAPKTASIHLERIALKLGVRGMLQTALAAISDGLVAVARQGAHPLFIGVLAWQVVGLDEGLRARVHSARVPVLVRAASKSSA